MAHMNENYAKLPGSYLFAEIARRTQAFTEENSDVELVKMGIGDVTRPLVPAVIEAMHAAVEDMSHTETFHGYGPEQVYVDTNAMAGRAGDWSEGAQAWTKIRYMPTTAENAFSPAIPEEPVDIVYLCSPNNPTGTVLGTAQLQRWVDYANEHGSVIMFDAAYERFIVEPDVPHSIFEIDGARTCAIEFRSFSKTAGFTGARCGYTVVPRELERDGQSLNKMWLRRQTTKFNGASYIIQRGAAAIYTEAGKRQTDAGIAYYRENARMIKEALESCGWSVYGAVNSPYVWCKTPDGVSSWEFFDELLQRAHVITTPGAGFGPAGEGYVRLTAFGSAEDTARAMERIGSL